MARSSAQVAEANRARIIAETIQQASVVGLTHVSLGEVAAAVGMSKPGVVGPFGSREQLTIEAFATAAAIFTDRVVVAVENQQPTSGQERLRLLIDAWVDYLTTPPFRGGCLLTSGSFDVDGSDGDLRQAVFDGAMRWRHYLTQVLRHAQADSGLTATSTDDVVTLLSGLAMQLDQAIQLFHDYTAPGRIRRLMHVVVGLGNAGSVS
jgi:AcrR family transcriptional regulator